MRIMRRCGWSLSPYNVDNVEHIARDLWWIEVIRYCERRGN